jgi:hypothetical protein
MSTDSKDTFKPNASQGDFWGGYMTDMWIYKILVFFPITGILGLDKLLLRSPFTALMKFLINIFFLGAWYIYDIIQVVIDSEFVGKYGFSNPYGVSGHGYRLLKGVTVTKEEEFESPSPYNGGLISGMLFMIYCISTFFFGFSGIPNMIAGDFNGGIVKLFSNFLIVPFFFYLFAQILDFFTKTSSVEKDGLSHPWPLYPMLTIFEKYPALNLVSEQKAKEELAAHTTKYEPLVKSGKLPLIPELFMALFGKVYEAANNIPVVAAFNTVSSAKGAALATSDMAQSAAKVGQKLATAVEQRISKNPNEVIDKLLGPSTPTLDSSIPSVPENPMMKKQEGGGSQLFPAELDTIMMMGMGVLILGGFAAALLRKFAVPRRQEEDEYPRKAYERDDTPPNPRGI